MTGMGCVGGAALIYPRRRSADDTILFDLAALCMESGIGFGSMWLGE